MPKAQPSKRERSVGRGFEGRALGGFHMLREIACGGMATIYLARRSGYSGFTQAAAVKVIHPHLAKDRDFVDMFLDEARIVSCINHPNVCRVLDFGKAEDTYYLAMEYVMGETWNEVLHTLKQAPETRALIPQLTTYVMAQACEGMHAAHDARDPEDKPLGIVHRDVSPQNLMLGYDGSVRVLDFGIASATDRLHTTRNGTIKGRFAYMAPEQMRGLSVDRRADVWSLGVVLWEALAQKRLFKRDTEAETVLAVTHDPLPTFDAPDAEVPKPLLDAVQRALSRNRDTRFASARDFGAELTHVGSTVLPAMGMADASRVMQRLFAQRIGLKREILAEAARASEAERPHTSSFPPAAASELQILATRALVANSQVPPSFSVVRELTREISEPPPRIARSSSVGTWLLTLLVFTVFTAATFFILRASPHSEAPARLPHSARAPLK